MLDFAAHVVVSAALLVLVAAMVRGFEISGALPALLGALALSLADRLITPQIAVTTPWPWVTFGVLVALLLVVNALILKGTAALVPGFRIRGFAPAIWGALLLSVLGLALERLVQPTW